MCKRLGNKGTATVETGIIIPVILFVIVLIIRLYIRLIDEGAVFGNTYKELYLYGVESDEQYVEDEMNEMLSVVVLDKDSSYGVNVNSANGVVSMVSSYNEHTLRSSTEYNKCTSRLRRWQVYGDVICE